MENFILKKYIQENSLYYRMKTDKNNEFHFIIDEYLTNKIGYSIHYSEIYCGIIFEKTVKKESGWKIHISTNINNSREILKIAGKILVENRTNFKYICDYEDLVNTCQKDYSRVQFGKFITIYPNDYNHFMHLIEELYLILKDYKGHYILTDRRYKDCEVLYYRYGAHFPKIFQNFSGDEDYFIVDGYGNHCRDERKPYFVLPAGIKDPFPIENKYEDAKFFNEYNFLSVIRYTNMGGIYKAENKQGNIVIVKEAKPYTSKMSLDDLNDSLDFKMNEYNFLEKLKGIKVAPLPIEKVKINGYLYIVEEYLEGEMLSDIFKQNPMYSPNFSSYKFVEYVRRCIDIIIKIAYKVKILINKKIVNSDLSDENIIVVNNEILFIDWESAIDFNEKSAITFSYKTVGFRANLSKVCIDDDVFSIYSLMLKCILNKIELIEINKNILKQQLLVYKSRYKFLNQYIDFLLDNFFDKYKTRYDIDKLIEFLNNYKTKIKSIHSEESELNYTFNGVDYLNEKIKKTILHEVRRWNTIDNVCIPYYNGNGLWFGNLGIVHYLDYVGIEVDKTFLNQVSRNELQNLPTFLWGKIGIFLYYLKKGIENYFPIDEINNTILLMDEIDLSYGLSGLGIYCMLVYKKTKIFSYRIASIKIAIKILTSNNLKVEKVGLGFGNSGVALFFVHFDLYFDKNMFKIIEKLVMKDMEFGVVEDGRYLGFPEAEGLKILYPYYWIGTAGICFVAIQFCKKYFCKYQSRVFDKIHILADSLLIQDSSQSGFFYGLSGIIYVLDEYVKYVNKDYECHLLKMIHMLSTHSFKKEGMMYFLSDKLYRVSLDIGSGMTGISMILNKVLTNNDFSFLRYDNEEEEQQL